VDDGVREACRAIWSTQYCDAADARRAGDACVQDYVATGAEPACASTATGCFELYTAGTACTGDRPIYPDAASCSAPVPRTCAFYAACLEQVNPCGASGYALGYGEKYCSRYDVDHRFSAEGLAWRDNVLHCLQESLVSRLSTPATCDDLTTFAFDSHPRCYTEGPSICFLPPSDALEVVSVIDGKDLLSLRSAKQVGTVAATCVVQLTGWLFGFDARTETVPAHDRDVIEQRLAFWRDVQARGAIQNAP
jgi:hypothetical protein